MQLRNLVLPLIVWLVGNPARAQAVFKAGDPESVVQNIFTGLFAGIALPKEIQDSARRVIRSENSKQMAIDGRMPGSWDQRLDLNRWRDSTLRVLLHTDADRKVFDANSERLRPQGRPPR